MAPGGYLSRLAARARRSLQTEQVSDRLAAIEARLAAIEKRQSREAPPGPVYFGEDRVLLTTKWGARMLVDTHDVSMAPWLAVDGLWEPHVTRWLRDALQPGMVFVDVGANVGYFTLLAADCVLPNGLVRAIEAHPRLAGILQRNVVLNGYHGFVSVRQAAAWSEKADLDFYMRDHFTSSSSLGQIDEEGLRSLGDTASKITVQALPLDDLLADLPRVDVIKIDIEGAEAHALAGLAGTLERNPQAVVMFEWGLGLIEALGDRPERLIDLVRGYGFDLVLLETGEPISLEQLRSLQYGNVLARR